MSFRRYAARRMAQAIPVILIVMTIVFFMVHLIPGNPAYVILGAQASAEQVTPPKPWVYLSVKAVRDGGHTDLHSGTSVRECLIAS